MQEVGVFDDKVALQMNDLVDDENYIVRRVPYMPDDGGQGWFWASTKITGQSSEFWCFKSHPFAILRMSVKVVGNNQEYSLSAQTATRQMFGNILKFTT